MTSESRASADMPMWKMRGLLATKEVTPKELVGAAISRAEVTNQTVGNLLTIRGEEAMEEARDAERRLASGDRSPLLGIPITVKDVLSTRGIRTTAGSILFDTYVPEEDAEAVKRAREAGAIIIGKGNTSEFGLFWRTQNRLMQECVNPNDTTRAAGGSSGGDAASVAAGVVPVALGSDRGGSGRIPASWCGVVGHQSGFDVIGSAGSMVPSLFFSGVSPIGSCARDVETLFGVIARPHKGGGRPMGQLANRGGGSRRRPLRVGWWSGDEYVEPEVRGRCLEVIGELAESDVDVNYLNWFGDSEAEEAYWLVNDADRATLFAKKIRSVPGWEEQVCDYVHERIVHGDVTSTQTVMEALLTRREFMRRMDGIFSDYDFIVTPTVPIRAPRLSEAEHVTRGLVTRYTWQVNFGDLTGASVPISAAGALPVGLQVIGRKRSDLAVLRLCADIERCVGAS